MPEIPEEKEKMNIADEAVFLKSLEGFLLVISPEGDFVYLSENVNEYLGITQVIQNHVLVAVFVNLLLKISD